MDDLVIAHLDLVIRSGPYPEGRSLRQRFWGMVDSQRKDQCWEWQGKRSRQTQYGRIRVLGKEYFAHRLSWIIHHGTIPGGLCVLHRCDVPACVNPHHLFTGTHDDNMQDMFHKGRNPGKPPTYLGERNPNSRLTADQVREIRQRYRDGVESYAALGREFNVPGSAVRKIILGINWGWLDRDSKNVPFLKGGCHV